MAGLKNIAKLFGSMSVTNSSGETTVWVWDYAKDKAVRKEEMSHEDWMASEKAKWAKLREEQKREQDQ